MSIVGRIYLERGEPVTVLAQWRGTRVPPDELVGGEPVVVLVDRRARPRGPLAPRNVLIRRADDSLVVRPLRGLRRAPDHHDQEQS